MIARNRKQQGRRRAQRGFALVELAVALMIGTLLLVWGSAAVMRRADDAAAQATGAWLLEIRQASQRMLERHVDILAEGGVPAGADGQPLYADARAPTLAEFKAQGLLPQGFSESAPTGGTALIRLMPPSACPGEACRVDMLVYASQALTDAYGAPDMMRMAVLTDAAGGYGGHASAGSAGRLRGKIFDFPNPYAPGAEALPAGTPVLWAGVDVASTSQSRYVRRFDDRDPQLKGGLTVAGGINGEGLVTGWRLQAREFLQVSGWASPGSGCESDGLVGRTGAGLLVSCQSGVWTASPPTQTVVQYFSGPGGGAFWANGTVSCPGGYKVLSGGAQCIAGVASTLSYSNPQGDWGWYASCETGRTGAETDIQVYAVCMMR
ncbi:MAG TPA: prepilin-type N-terminal cleavage/methylation domain-containing protein [Bordetella sp.]